MGHRGQGTDQAVGTGRREGVILADLSFEREVRTPYSEAYLVMEQDRQVGRVDIHFTPEMVHVAVSVDESLTQETIRQIIDTVDEDIVDSVGITRGNFVVHVFQGRETGVFSDENGLSENGSDR